MDDKNPFAALLDGINGHTVNFVERGPVTFIERDKALAALAAAMDPALSERAGNLLPDLQKAMVPYDPEVDAQEYWETLCSLSADLITALLARITAQEAQIKGLQRTYDDLYSDALADAKSDAQDFESDLWKMVRAYLDELHFDWRDFMEDGVTADEAMTHIRECMNEETRRAETAETALAAERAKVAKLVGTLDNIATELTGVIPEPDNMRMAIDTAVSVARAAITEVSQ